MARDRLSGNSHLLGGFGTRRGPQPFDKVCAMPLNRDPLVSHHRGVAQAIASAWSASS
jgi:hypothetical protein